MTAKNSPKEVLIKALESALDHNYFLVDLGNSILIECPNKKCARFICDSLAYLRRVYSVQTHNWVTIPLTKNGSPRLLK